MNNPLLCFVEPIRLEGMSKLIMKMKNLPRLLLCILVCLIPGILGSFATFEGVTTWYVGLNKPFFTPPDWVFAPVWTSLYILMGVALYLVSSKRTPVAKHAVNFFLSHLVVNGVWPFVFFKYYEIGMALGVSGILWLMILGSIGLFWSVDRRAAYLLLPYLLWVSFATVLNFSFFTLN